MKKKKKQIMKDFVNNNVNNVNNYFLLDDVNLGSFISNWKGNFINKNNSCFKDSYTQNLVHSLSEDIKYEENKKQKMKDFVKKNGNNIILLNNENLGSFIKHCKGNFKNKNNSCFKDSYVQSLVHSMIETIVKKEEELRKQQGLPIAKDFKIYGGGNNSNSNNFYGELLYLLDNIKDKMKKNDLRPTNNTYNSTHISMDQKYSTGGGYATYNTAKLSRSSTSTSTSSGLIGGSLSVIFKKKNFNTTFVKDHEIFLKEKL